MQITLVFPSADAALRADARAITTRRGPAYPGPQLVVPEASGGCAVSPRKGEMAVPVTDLATGLRVWAVVPADFRAAMREANGPVARELEKFKGGGLPAPLVAKATRRLVRYLAEALRYCEGADTHEIDAWAAATFGMVGRAEARLARAPRH